MAIDKLENIKNKIDVKKLELYEKINKSNGELSSMEIIQLSQELDELILDYVKLVNS